MIKQTNDDRAGAERLHRLLSEQLTRRRPAGMSGRVTVAEIYQELIPYRTVRQELGFEETEQYERALLRLLAGEGDLVQLEPPEAREEIRRELRSSNPNVTRYREYAACDVIVRPPRSAPPPALDPAGEQVPWYVAETDEDEAAPAPSAEDAAEEFPDVSLFALAEEPPGLVEEAPPAESGPPQSQDVRPSSQAAPASAPDTLLERVTDTRSARCAYCDSPLPSQRAVRYCPYCGADQSTKPCGSCGEAVEPNWVFCIACGASVDD